MLVQDLEVDEIVSKVDALKAERIRLEAILESKKQESDEFLSQYKTKIRQIQVRIDNMKMEETINPLVKPIPKPIQPHKMNQIDADYRIRLATSTSTLEHTQAEYDNLKQKLQRQKNNELKKAKKKKNELDILIDSTNELKVENMRIKEDIASMKEEIERLREDTLQKQALIEEYDQKTTNLATEAERIVQKHYRGYSRALNKKYKF